MRSREVRTRISSKPHASAIEALGKIYDGMWDDLSQGRVLVCWPAKVADLLWGTHSAPMGAVTKANVDGTPSDKVRPIHDEREQNVGCDKEEHPPSSATNPRARCQASSVVEAEVPRHHRVAGQEGH